MLIFCNRRNTTEDVAESLARRGIRCEMLSGDVNQNRRLRVLEDFREGKIRTVVATDVAGRGLHVDDIGFVVNFDFPYEPEDYVHRIGRTGRAAAEGDAFTLATPEEESDIRAIERFIGQKIPQQRLEGFDYHAPAVQTPRSTFQVQPGRGGQPGPSRGGQRGHAGGRGHSPRSHGGGGGQRSQASSQPRPAQSGGAKPHAPAAESRPAPKPMASTPGGASTAKQTPRTGLVRGRWRPSAR